MAHNCCITPGISASLFAAGLFLGAAGCASLDRMTSPSDSKDVELDPAVRARIEALSARWEQEPVPVGLEPQVFFDDAVILSRTETLERRVGRAEKLATGEPVVKPDLPCEGDRTGAYISVLTNQAGLFQTWYSTGRQVYRDMRVGSYVSLGYAYSEDGLTWTKPRLLPSLDNIVLHPAFGVGVYYDLHDPRAGHRYKAVYGTVGVSGSSHLEGLTFAYSRNGTHWSAYKDVRMLNDARSDTLSNLFWDEELGMYRLYTRIMTDKGRSSRLYVRPLVGPSAAWLVGKALFLPVGVQPWMKVSDSPAPDSGEIYAMTVYKYGQLYIGKMALFHDQHSHRYVLALSRDGAVWDFQYADAEHEIVPLGEEGSFDAGNAFPAASPPIEKDGQWLIYYGAGEVPRGEVGTRKASRPYERSIGLATIRKEGFFYLENTAEEAVLTTKAFVLEGGALEVNADAHGGEVRVDIAAVGTDGRASAWRSGQPIRGDGIRLSVEWPEEALASLQGRIVRLRFVVTGPVRLYGFQVAK